MYNIDLVRTRNAIDIWFKHVTLFEFTDKIMAA